LSIDFQIKEELLPEKRVRTTSESISGMNWDQVACLLKFKLKVNDHFYLNSSIDNSDHISFTSYGTVGQGVRVAKLVTRRITIPVARVRLPPGVIINKKPLKLSRFLLGGEMSNPQAREALTHSKQTNN